MGGLNKAYDAIGLKLNRSLDFFQHQTKKPEIVSSDMTALIFIILYYFFKPVFVNFGLNDKVRFFIAIGVGMVAETVLFALTGTSVYGIVVN